MDSAGTQSISVFQKGTQTTFYACTENVKVYSRADTLFIQRLFFRFTTHQVVHSSVLSVKRATLEEIDLVHICVMSTTMSHAKSNVILNVPFLVGPNLRIALW